LNWQNEARREGYIEFGRTKPNGKGYIEFGRTNPPLERDLAAIFIGIECRF